MACASLRLCCLAHACTEGEALHWPGRTSSPPMCQYGSGKSGVISAKKLSRKSKVHSLIGSITGSEILHRRPVRDYGVSGPTFVYTALPESVYPGTSNTATT